ncbi:MAG: hypothetical protein EB125_10965, partial [Betaproteobacteria bacterium]|nr:hypothetical protein [Betaproteobacteria bacterium]
SYVDNAHGGSKENSGNSTADTTPGLLIGKNLVDTPNLYVDGTKVASTYDPVTGTLTPVVPLGKGDHKLSYSLSDAAGNESGRSGELSLNIDLDAPNTPSTAPMSYIDNEGDSVNTMSTARSTDDTTPGIQVGIGLADSPSLYVNGFKVAATYDKLNGTLTPDMPLNAGQYVFTYTLTDAAGNESGQSPGLSLDINPSPVSLLSFTQGAVAKHDNITLTFNQDMVKGSSGSVSLFKSDGSLVETIDISSNQIDVNHGLVTINPTSDLVLGVSYYVLVSSHAFLSASGKVYSGITNPNTIQFHPTDPVTTVKLGGTGVNSSDGINANELAQLVIEGTVSSDDFSVITSLGIRKITFTPSVGPSFSITSDLPVIDPLTKRWTLSHQSAWVNQLINDQSYRVSVELSAAINGSPVVSTAMSANVLLDATPPETPSVAPAGFIDEVHGGANVSTR